MGFLLLELFTEFVCCMFLLIKESYSIAQTGHNTNPQLASPPTPLQGEREWYALLDWVAGPISLVETLVVAFLALLRHSLLPLLALLRHSLLL